MPGAIPTIMAYCPTCGKVHTLPELVDGGGYICIVEDDADDFILYDYGYVGYKNYSTSPCQCLTTNHYLFDEHGRECLECHLPVFVCCYDEYMPRFVDRMWLEALGGCHSQELENTFPEAFGEILAEVEDARAEELAPHLPRDIIALVLGYFGAVAIVPPS